MRGIAAALRMRIRDIAQTRAGYGYGKSHVLLNRDGCRVGKYLSERIYRKEGSTLQPRRKRRRRITELRRAGFHPTGLDQVGPMDIVAGQLADRRSSVADRRRYLRAAMLGGRVRAEAVKGEEVVLVPNRIKLQRGVPKLLYRNKGSEFSSHAFVESLTGTLGSRHWRRPSRSRRFGARGTTRVGLTGLSGRGRSTNPLCVVTKKPTRSMSRNSLTSPD